ncbi:hypothetical protein VTN02DRAFT_4313 [Thermoascus thermophilus]
MQRETMGYAEMDEREDGDGWKRVGVGLFSLRGGEPLHFGRPLRAQDSNLKSHDSRRTALGARDYHVSQRGSLTQHVPNTGIPATCPSVTSAILFLKPESAIAVSEHCELVP